MIHSDESPSQSTIHQRDQHSKAHQRPRAHSAGRWQAAALLAMAGTLPSLPASGCDDGAACGGKIDSFFLPLIVNSLTDGPQTASMASPPTQTPDSILPSRPVIIRPPPRPLSDRQARALTARRIKLEQQLIAGSIAEGGKAELTVHVDPVPRPAPAASGPKQPAREAAISPLRLAGDAAATWQARHVAVLPLHATWPLGKWQQPVTMRLACGSCGRNSGVAHFSGTATFKMAFDMFAEGWIEDIDLTSADGLEASGHISFLDDWPSRHLAVDHEAVMALHIDGKEGKLGGSLATWLGQDRRVAGMFTGTQIDDAADFGGIAGQFRGEACAVACGAEN